jgi:hypothetical protein
MNVVVSEDELRFNSLLEWEQELNEGRVTVRCSMYSVA